MKKTLIILLVLVACLLISCQDNAQKGITDINEQKSDEFTVSFNVNGGNENIENQTVDKNSVVSEPKTPTKEGYIFTGWYCNGEKWSFDTLIKSDVCLEAIWVENHFTFIEEGGTWLVQSCENVSGTVTVPEYYNGTQVTGIYKNAFRGCNKIKNVILPDSITTIGEYAFEECILLSRINVPASVTKIGKSAFKDCYALKEIYYAAENLEDFQEYNMVFYDAGVKTSGITVIFAKTVKRIPNRLFDADCDSVFLNTEQHKDDTRIPKVIAVIFEENSECYEIGQNAFCKLKTLTDIALPDTVKVIGNSAFSYCEKIESLNLPRSICEIGESAFFNCSGLKEITFPTLTVSRSEIKIGDRTFFNCDGLTNIDFNNNMISMGTEVFYYCSSLETVNLGDNVKKISPYTFYECQNLKNISIGRQIEEIGEYAFYYCKRLETIEFPDTLTTIGSNAFYRCYGLETISIPNSVTHLGSSSFEYCNNLKKVYIGRGITKLNRYVFGCCSSLEYAFIPINVKTILEETFYRCFELVAFCEADNKPPLWSENWSEDVKEIHWGQ